MSDHSSPWASESPRGSEKLRVTIPVQGRVLPDLRACISCSTLTLLLRKETYTNNPGTEIRESGQTLDFPGSGLNLISATTSSGRKRPSEHLSFPKQNLGLWLSSISGAHLHPEPVFVKQEQDLRINMNDTSERYRRAQHP